MPQTSTRAQEKTAVAKAMHEDCHGFAFPPTRGETGQVRRTTAQDKYRAMMAGKPCALCRKQVETELHHIIGGAGRSDEYCNFLMLCHACHMEIQSQPADYPRVWKAKWQVDREHCDWRRLIELLGRVPFTSLD